MGIEKRDLDTLWLIGRKLKQQGLLISFLTGNNTWTTAWRYGIERWLKRKLLPPFMLTIPERDTETSSLWNNKHDISYRENVKFILLKSIDF